MRRTCLLVFLLLSFASCMCVANVVVNWVPSTYPNPQTNFTACGMPSPSWICDPSAILNVSQAIELNNVLINITNTKCPCSTSACAQNGNGYRVSVALVRDPLGTVVDVDSSAAESINDNNLRNLAFFAYGLLTDWHFGQCAEDVVVVYYMPSNMVYTATSAAAGAVLTNDIISQIVQKYMIYLGPKKSNYVGLYGILSTYRQVFSSQFNSTYYALEQPLLPAADTSAAHSGLYTSSLHILCSTCLMLFVAVLMHLT